MPATYYCKLTTTGQNKLANAQATQIPLPLTQFCVGDSNGQYYEPTGNEAALVHEVWRGNVNRVYVHASNANWIVVEALIPATQGGFDIREAGVLDNTGALIAIAKVPLTNKPAPGSGSEKDLYVRMIFQVTNATSVQQTIDNSLVMATKEYVNASDLAIASGKSIIGYGWEPLGGVIRIDDNDPRIKYSVGDWTRFGNTSDTIEGLNNYWTQSIITGASCTISFIGTGLNLGTVKNVGQGIIAVSVDGGAETQIDLYTALQFRGTISIVSGLAFGFHTVKLTIIGKNTLSNYNSLIVSYFEVIATTDASIRLAKDGILNKSSAITLGNRNDSTVDLTQNIDAITNLVPNADFSRVSPTWGTVFRDDFNRADGAVGNGWSAGSVATNQLSIPASTLTKNGSLDWKDREFKFSFVAPSVGLRAYARIIDDNNWITAVMLTGTANNFCFEKKVNGTQTSNISLTGITITAGTTYYVTVKAQGNIFSVSITTNSDYVTGTTTIHAYDDNLLSGQVGFYASANSAATLIDNVAVTAPVPDAWLNYSSTSSIVSISNGIWKVTNNLSNVSILDRLGDYYIPVVAGQTYTFVIKREINSYTSGNGVNITIDWRQSDKTTSTGAVSSNLVTSTDADFVQVVLTATAPTNTAYAYPYIRIDGVLVCEVKEPIFVQGSTVPAFHTKEQRCDLVALQSDGNITVVKGTGKSELGYRVEAEDGSISKFYRDKKTVQHWDRTKVWRGGTGWSQNSYSGKESNGARIVTDTTNDSLTISFVGTGIDVLIQQGNSGIMGVTLDGGTEFLVDCFYSTSDIKDLSPMVKLRGLPYGQHQVKLRCTGTRNTLASGNYLSLDAFDVYVPTIPETPANAQPLGAVITADPDYGWVRYEQNEGVVYSGAYSTNEVISNRSGGTRTVTTNANTTDYAEFSFIGTRVRWVGLKDTANGIAEVLIDDVSKGNIDTYGATTLQAVLFSSDVLSLALHKIKVKNTNTKNASSTGNTYEIDAFDVKQPIHVIDLRKFLGQVDIEARILEHEQKELHDAHPWAIKGLNKKERRESGSGSANISTANTAVAVSMTFSKAFTVPPKVKVWVESAGYNDAYIVLIASSPTTTGFSCIVNSGKASTITFGWEAIGY